MGKSKHARSAHQNDTKKAENEGNSQKFEESIKTDFSGLVKSKNSPDLFTPGSSALASMRDAGDGEGSGNGVLVGRVSAGNEMSTDDVVDGRADVSDAYEETVPDSLSSSKSIDYPGTLESMAESHDKAVSDSRRENDGTDVEIEESSDDSSNEDADVELDKSDSGQTPMKITNLAKKLTQAAATILRDGANPTNTVKLGEAAVAVDIAFAAAVDAAVADKLKTIEKQRAIVKVSAKASVAEPSTKAATGPEQLTIAATGPVGTKAEISGLKSDVNVTANAADFNPMHSRSPVVNAIKSWASIVKTNRSPDAEVFELSSEEGELEDDDTLPMEDEDCREEEIEKMRLVGVFSSKFPGRAAVQKMVDSWPRYCEYHYHRSGWIVFCFKSENDAMEVLQSGPYRPYGMPFTLKRMPKFFNFSKEDHSIVPIWIQLPNLPLRLWTKKALSKICSQVGTPLHTDKMTASINVPSFARCLVDVDLSKPRREVLNIRPPKGGKKFKQHILYENSPPYCSNCKRLGHVASACKGIDYYVTPLYVPKKPKAATGPVGPNDGKKKNIKNTSNSSKTAADKSSATESGAAVVGPNPETVGTGSGAHSGVKNVSATVSGHAGQTSGKDEVRAGTTLASGAVSGGVAGAVSGSAAAQAGDKTPEKGVVKTGLMTPGTYDAKPDTNRGNAKGAPSNKNNNKKKNGNNKRRKDHG